MAADGSSIQIVGPREPRLRVAPFPVINCCSSSEGWERGLSPFVLGPCEVYGGFVAARHENLWQFSKLYAKFADSSMRPLASYWTWAAAGWKNPRAVRYPMGKGAVPLGAWWDGRLLGYVESRRLIYFPKYRDAVRNTDSFRTLNSLYREAGRIALWDFDGYDHDRLGMTLGDVVGCTEPGRKMGHAFVLKAMLLYGAEVRPEDL